MNGNSYIDFCLEQEKNREDKDNIYCRGITDSEFVYFITKYLDEENWYVADPLGDSQIKQIQLERILLKYSKEFRKELDNYEKSLKRTSKRGLSRK